MLQSECCLAELCNLMTHGFHHHGVCLQIAPLFVLTALMICPVCSPPSPQYVGAASPTEHLLCRRVQSQSPQGNMSYLSNFRTEKPTDELWWCHHARFAVEKPKLEKWSRSTITLEKEKTHNILECSTDVLKDSWGERVTILLLFRNIWMLVLVSLGPHWAILEAFSTPFKWSWNTFDWFLMPMCWFRLCVCFYTHSVAALNYSARRSQECSDSVPAMNSLGGLEASGGGRVIHKAGLSHCLRQQVDGASALGPASFVSSASPVTWV